MMMQSQAGLGASPLAAASILPLSRIFHPLGFNVEIRTNHPAVLEAATEVWGHLRARRGAPAVIAAFSVHGHNSLICPPAPKPLAHEHLLALVADADNVAFCDLNQGFAFAALSRSAVSNLLYFRYHFLESIPLALLSARYAPALHAACVSRNGTGLLFCGCSGAGKSTLSYACARAGFTYTSDDASYLILDSPTPRVAGHSHKFRFRPHSRDLFPELRDRELTPRLEGKPSIEVPTNSIPGIRAAPDSPVHALIILKRSPGATARLIPIPIESGLVPLRESLYPVGIVRQRHLAELEHLRVLDAYEFHYDELNAATRCLKNFTAGHAG